MTVQLEHFCKSKGSHRNIEKFRQFFLWLILYE